jgi:AraC family transcriptional regulator, arabinose operon regulatory protein
MPKPRQAAPQRSLSGKLPIVQSMGISTWDPIWAKKDHVDQQSELVYIRQGEVTLHLDGKKFKARSGDILVIPAGHSHRDEFPVDALFEALLVHFVWPDVERAFIGITNADLTVLPLADKLSTKEMVLDLYHTFRGNRSLVRELMDVSLYRILLFLISAVRESRLHQTRAEAATQKEQRQQKISAVKEYIQKNISRPITLTDLANHLGMSTYHLSHIFSQESGFTLSAYLTQVRMQEAARLLADPKNRVLEAGYAVGFEDPNYFGKAFRKHFGQSPGAYRARILRQNTK